MGFGPSMKPDSSMQEISPFRPDKMVGTALRDDGTTPLKKRKKKNHYTLRKGKTYTFAHRQTNLLKTRLKRLLPATFLLCMANMYSHSSVAQTTVTDTLSADTTSASTATDTAVVAMETFDTVKYAPFQPNPKRAGLYSALIPGLGQIYNRQYWKLPIVYGALGVATYFLIDDINLYQKYRQAYIGRINNSYPNDEFPQYNQDQLRQLQEDANSEMNMMVLYTSLGFVLQIVDAITSAHLKNFDISRDISLVPVATPKGMGMGVAFHF